MEWDIKYNTAQDELIISEYGRTVQELLQNADQVEDPQERQAYVERVIQLMLQMQPEIKQQENYEARLWKHAFRIAGGQLDVQVPEGIDATPDAEKLRPDPLAYPDDLNQRKRHYGNNVARLIDAGKEMEDGPERDHLTYTAAYYMKIALSDWSQGKFYNEDMIRSDLYEMSDKKLVLPPDAKIGSYDPNSQPKQDTGRKRKKKKNNKSSKNRSNRNNRSNRRRR